jgi:glycosyltransferase involved in cell wall biosynthesis
MRSHAAALAPAHDVAIGLQLGAARYLVDAPGVPRVFEEVEVTAPLEEFRNAPSARARVRAGLTWWKARHFVHGVVDAVERATVVSTIERDALAAIGCDVDRIQVVPNGVEMPAVPAVTPHGPRLIYPGSVLFDANLDAVRHFVHDVFPRIRSVRPDATFWVTGATDGVDVTDLTTPGVTFTGRLPEVESAIAGSAACVVPLRVGGGTRLKVLQAMALGVPVVATPKGIEGLELVAERDVLVGRSPDEFAAQTLRILGDPALGHAVASRARRVVRDRYDWDGIADTLDRVIHDAARLHATSRRLTSAAAHRPSSH